MAKILGNDVVLTSEFNLYKKRLNKIVLGLSLFNVILLLVVLVK